jgi:hypothetical protein
MAERIQLVPNVPLILKLLDPFADSSERYDPELRICEYRTEDGRILALPRQAAILLNGLNPQPGEEIGICRRVADKPGQEVTGTLRPHIEVWLSPRAEKARAAQEAAAVVSPDVPSDEELLLKASIEREQARKRVREIPRNGPRKALDPQPRLFDRGTGTDGPAPARMPLIPAASAPTRRDRPLPIPWNVAFREVSAWVSKELAANSLQWSDQAQQAMVCTVLIAEAKAGRVTVWERGE